MWSCQLHEIRAPNLTKLNFEFTRDLIVSEQEQCRVKIMRRAYGIAEKNIIKLLYPTPNGEVITF